MGFNPFCSKTLDACTLSCRGLLYCMEYLEEELEDWLAEQLEPYGDDDYLLFDCPGQIELYSHSSVFRALVKYLQSNGWQVCHSYCQAVRRS